MLNTQRILNEGACLRFLAEKTDIPVPKLYACFEDDGARCLITEYVNGVGMNDLNDEQKTVVIIELERHVQTLQSLTSDAWGDQAGWVMRNSNARPWKIRPRADQSLVFCHNDLSAHNVIVDPAYFKINAIIDWEYSGFFPPEFERNFYLRLGPSVALPGEVDDVDVLTKMIEKEKM